MHRHIGRARPRPPPPPPSTPHAPMQIAPASLGRPAATPMQAAWTGRRRRMRRPQSWLSAPYQIGLAKVTNSSDGQDARAFIPPLRDDLGRNLAQFDLPARPE